MKADRAMRNVDMLILLATGLLILGIASFLLQPAITGLTVGDNIVTYNETLGITAYNSTTVEWIPQIDGRIRSVAISGTVFGNGSAKVYLDDGSRRYLIYDNSQSTSSNQITGFAVLETSENITTDSSNLTVFVNRSVVTVLEYGNNPEFDQDNDGSDANTNAIDYSVDSSVFNWDVNSEALCTIWDIYSLDTNIATGVCYGNNICCSVAGLESQAASWNEPYVSFVGMHGATENNEISARVVFANISTQTENVMTDIVYGEWASLPASFYEPGFEFVEECEESCILPNIFASNYSIVVEIENSTLEIDTISYKVMAQDRSLPVQVSVKKEKKLEDVAVERGLNWDKVCDGKVCKVATSIRPKNILVNGNLVPFTEYVKASWKDDKFVVSFDNYSYALQVEYEIDGRKVSEGNLGREISSAMINKQLEEATSAYKWAFEISDNSGRALGRSQIDRFSKVTLRVTDLVNLSDNDFVVDKNSIITKGIEASFDDLAQNFTINVTKDFVEITDISILSFDPTIRQNITDNGDDAHDTSDGGFPGYSNSSDTCSTGFQASGARIIYCGLRFSVSIPAGSTITTANISGKTPSGISGDVDLLICGETGRNDPPAFTGTDSPFDRFSDLSDCVRWDAATFSFQGSYTTPDISSTVQAILDQDGWESGEHMVLVINGSDEASNFVTVSLAAAESTLADSEAVLFVEYEEPSNIENNGTLNVTLHAQSVNMSWNSTTTVNISVACVGGSCANVTLQAYHNFTGAIDTPLNATALEIPFGNVSLDNSCSQFMDNAETCSASWTVNATAIPDYHSQWTLNATSNRSQVLANGSSVFFINVSMPPQDESAPNISINVPSDNLNLTGLLLINVSINDTSAVKLANVSLLQPGQVAYGPVALTLSSGDTFHGYYNATVDTALLSDGKYNISVNASDNKANSDVSSNLTITIDSFGPNASGIVPVNDTLFQDEAILINASVNDTTSGIKSVRYRFVGPQTSDWTPALLTTGSVNSGYWTLTASSSSLQDGLYNITLNATDYAENELLVNISSVEIDNTETYAPVLFTNARNPTKWSTQRKLFWSGEDWVAVYLHLSGASHLTYNHSNDLQTWLAGGTASYSLDANAYSDISFKEIDGNKTFAVAVGLNPGRNMLNISRGVILENGSVNVTNLVLFAHAGLQSSAHIMIDSFNHYWVTAVDSVHFASSTSNRSIYPDLGYTWDSGSGFNVSGGNLGSDFPDSVMIPLENGNIMQLAVSSTGSLTVRNFTPDPWTFSSSTTVASDIAAVHEWGAIELNESGLQNVHFVYRTTSGTIKHYKSDGGDRTDWDLQIELVDDLPKVMGGIVLSRNETNLFMFYINTSATQDKVMYRWHNGTNWSTARTMISNVQNKTYITSAPLSNGTDIAVGWSDGYDVFNFSVTNLTHASILRDNLAPVVVNVTPVTVTPIENSTQIHAIIQFNATDADGASDLLDSSARVNVSLAQDHFRYNDTGNCAVNSTGTNYNIYSCTVIFKYYDNASSYWVINATVSDTFQAQAHNDSQNVTVNSLSAFQITTSEISVTSNSNTNDVELIFTFNNTGNFDFTTLNITPYDLNASLTDFFRLDGNFSINGTTSGSGVGSPLRNGSPIVINDTTGPINLTHARSDGSHGWRNIYIYIDIPPEGMITVGATYNTTPGRQWRTYAE